MSPELFRLLRETIVRRQPSCVGVVDAMPGRLLTDYERESLREVIAEELGVCGIDPRTSKPTSLGLQLEELIDVLEYV